jgi:hypothetical protein
VRGANRPRCAVMTMSHRPEVREVAMGVPLVAEADTQRLEGAVSGTASVWTAICIVTRVRTHRTIMTVMISETTIMSVHIRSPLGVLKTPVYS